MPKNSVQKNTFLKRTTHRNYTKTKTATNLYVFFLSVDHVHEVTKDTRSRYQKVQESICMDIRVCETCMSVFFFFCAVTSFLFQQKHTIKEKLVIYIDTHNEHKRAGQTQPLLVDARAQMN